MIFESITYQDNLPFKVSFLNVGEESKHCHKEIEILMILRGTTHYQIYHTDYELNSGDLIIADLEDLHQIHNSSEDILMLSIHVNTKYFEDIYPNIGYMFFVCEECMAGPLGNRQILNNKLSLLKHQIAKLAIDSTNPVNNLNLLKEDINDLVSILVNHFQGFFMEDYQYKTSQENLNPVDLQRLSRITRFILENYKEKISLEDVANMEHLSSYYISHLIKKTLGFNFQNFVNAIRLEFAEKLLVFSNLTLMQISEECGFSSPNYFNKCFSSWHGKTPAEYRKNYHPCERSYRKDFSDDEALALIAPYINISGSSSHKHIPQSHLRINLEIFGHKTDSFWEKFSPVISLKTMDEIFQVKGFEEKIKSFNAKLVLNPNLSKSKKTRLLPLNDINMAYAYYEILNSEHMEIDLIGKSASLFINEGIPTPYYAVYNYFSHLSKPFISVHENYAYVKTSDAISFILFNIDDHTLLNAHLSTDNLPEEFYMIKTEIAGRDNCYSILDSLGNPVSIPPLLKSHLMELHLGSSDITLCKRKETPILDFVVQPGRVTILEFISL